MKKFGFWMLIIMLAGMLVIGGCNGQEVAENGHDHDQEHDQDEEYVCELEGEDYPFEWSGEYTLEEGTYTFEFQESHDPSCAVAFLLNEGSMDEILHHAHHVMEADMETVEPMGSFTATADFAYDLTLDPDGTTFSFEVQETGEYVVFLEHFPHEFDLKILDSQGDELQARNPVEHVDDHHHDHSDCDHDHDHDDHDHEERDH